MWVPYASEKTTKRLKSAERELNWAKDDLKSEKAKEKINKETGTKSKRRLKLEEEYRNKGMTEEEAEIAAYKRARTEKILAATVGVTVAATAAYVAYKHYDKVTDRILKPGTLLQNISGDSNKGVQDAFYAAYKDGDKTKYRGYFAKQHLMGRNGLTDIYDAKIGLKDNLKIASEKSGTKVLADLVKSNPDYAEKLERQISDYAKSMAGLPKHGKLFQDSLKSLQSGKVDSKTYEALNIMLANHGSDRAKEISKGFYDKMKEAGYDAVFDVNDKKYSGYHSSKPVIVFDGGLKTTVSSISKLSTSDIEKNYIKGVRDITVKELAPAVAKSGVAFISAYTLAKQSNKIRQTRRDDEIVREYRNEHPNTELSYREILRMEQNNK